MSAPAELNASTVLNPVCQDARAPEMETAVVRSIPEKPVIAVLIPCYNEAQTIGKVVADFRRAVPDATIYVYDNNSTDHTAAIARAAGAVVVPEFRQGKGHVIRSMFRNIEADCYVMADGDDTYPAEHCPDMIRLIQEGRAEMVIGDRLSATYHQENKRSFHSFGNNLVRALINLVFKSAVHDIMTGYRAFSREFVKTFPILSGGFEIETEMTIHALDKNFLLQEVPVQYRDRPAGSVSKLNTVRDGIRVIRTIVTLSRSYRPFLFFSLISLLLVLLSLGLFLPVLLAYIQTGLVERFPTLIVSGFIAMAALLSFFSGLILDTLKKQHRQDFELRLLETANRNHIWMAGK